MNLPWARRRVVFLWTVLLAAGTLFTACAGPRQGVTERPVKPEKRAAFVRLPEKFRQRARQAEQAKKYREAASYWQVVATLRPGDTDAATRFTVLRSRLRREADSRFQKGVSFFEQGDTAAARREFLLALAADPDHDEALGYVKNRLETDAVRYEVSKGDTLAGIADKVYGDPEKAYLVARLNDLSPEEAPQAGTMLTLPVFEYTSPPAPEEESVTETEEMAHPELEPPATTAEPALPPGPTEQEQADYALSQSEILLAQAVENAESGNYREVLALAEQIPSEDPVGGLAGVLMNEAYFNLGKEFEKEKKYLEARAMYQKVDAGYENIEKTMAALEKLAREAAQKFYIQGVQLFVDQKLEAAINEWQSTLALDPEHPKALKDIENARKLLEKLEKIQ